MKRLGQGFWGMAGASGVGVMDSQETVLRTRTYLRKATAVSFNSFEEAEKWALDQFAKRFPDRIAPRSLRLNWVIYARRCELKN